MILIFEKVRDYNYSSKKFAYLNKAHTNFSLVVSLWKDMNPPKLEDKWKASSKN